MQRVASIMFGLCLFPLFSAPTEAKLNIFACLPEWQALANELGGDAVTTFVAVGPLTNPDHVQVTPALIVAIKEADLLICTGADFEGEWLPGALKRANNPKLRRGKPGLFFARDFVQGLKDSQHGHDAGQANKPHEHLHQHGNPHVQGDPYRVRALAGQLGRRMIEIDRSEAKRYAANTRAFVRDLGALIKSLEAKAAPLRGVNIAAQHEHSVYLLNWLKINSVAIVEPQVGVPPGPADLARIIKQVPRDNIKFIIHAAYENPRPSAYVAKRAKIPLVRLPFTIGGTDDAKTFADFYRSAVGRMLDALAGNDRP
jgi:zinc/manganese transport system substrate-binding protein